MNKMTLRKRANYLASTIVNSKIETETQVEFEDHKEDISNLILESFKDQVTPDEGEEDDLQQQEDQNLSENKTKDN